MKSRKKIMQGSITVSHFIVGVLALVIVSYFAKVYDLPHHKVSLVNNDTEEKIYDRPCTTIEDCFTMAEKEGG